MDGRILGIHHVTAIAGDPQRNLDFYGGILGLRLVKLTVNFDDPGTYHFYFGDVTGHPGTIITFFPWPRAPRGRRGAGQATAVAFAIPEGSLSFWMEHLRRHGVPFAGPAHRFGQEFLVLADPDGLVLGLVPSQSGKEFNPPTRGPVNAEHAIRGLHSVTLMESQWDATSSLLEGTLGFRFEASEENWFRYRLDSGGSGTIVDVLRAAGEAPGVVAVGTVHHVAWRVSDGATQKTWRAKIVDDGVAVTNVLDRKYFTSIYFREPGGVLFEIATDPPGFAIDESPEELGTGLMLPLWLESRRKSLESTLPRVIAPRFARAA
jgi:catechol 2,3-dioxygenase-like lactoylglutathione lyase family enzyme